MLFVLGQIWAVDFFYCGEHLSLLSYHNWSFSKYHSKAQILFFDIVTSYLFIQFSVEVLRTYTSTFTNNGETIYQRQRTEACYTRFRKDMVIFLDTIVSTIVDVFWS